MSVAAAQILALPAVKYAVERRHYLIAACGVAVFFFVARKWVRNGQNAPPRPPRSSKPPSQENPPTFDVASVVDSGEIADSVMEGVAVSLNAMIQEEENEQEKAIVEHLQQQPEDPLALAELARKEKAKRKKAKLKQTVIDGVGLVMGDSAGKLVESVIELSQQAKRSGVESFVKTGKLGKLFSKDIIPILKSKLQGKKFPTIVGSTDSPLGALQYEVSGITLDALEIDPSLQCDITDGQEALQLRLLISSAKLKNIAWKCGTAKIKEKGTADAEIVKAELLFRISIDKSQVIPKLSIKHCSIDIQQFNLQLGGGKASWMYNLLTSVFSNKIRTKLKEKIDKSLTKKCRQFETKINFAATKILSIFSDKKEKRLSDTVLLTPHKKCFLYANETMTEELECVLLDLRLFTEMVDLRTAFFGELGISHSTAHTRVRFRDKSGTLVTVSKSTTMAQIIEHAEHLCFYKETSQSLSSSSPGATSTLQLDASVSSSSLSSSFSSSSSSSLFLGCPKQKKPLRMNSLFATLVLLVTLFCLASFVEARYQPLVGDSFFIDLASGDSISRTTPGTAAKIYDVNLTSTSNTTIAALKAAGINVVCYVPIGVASPTNSDYASIPTAALGNHVSNTSNLRYLDVSNVAIYPVIQARIALAASKGCDGVDLAYSDTYGNATFGTNTGFDLTLDDSVLFFQNMANYAHIKNMAAGLRNGAALIPFVEQKFADFSVVENCFYKNALGGPGCGQYSDFIEDYHPVFPIEYLLAPNQWCRRSNKLRFFGGYYPVSLNGTYTWCSTVATLAATPSQSLPLSTSTSVAATPSLGASQVSAAATNPISPSAQASPSKSSKASQSNEISATGSKSSKASATGSKSSKASQTGAPSPSSSLAASVGSSPAASVNPTVVNTLAASPSVAASVTNACITCTSGCGSTASPLYNKCLIDLQGTPSSTSTSFCCATNLTPFSYVWRVDAANCSVSRNERKLGRLCTALKGTVTCASANKVGKVKLTCA